MRLTVTRPRLLIVFWLVIAGGIVWGMNTLDRRVHADPAFNLPLQIKFVDDGPEAMWALMRAQLGEFVDQPWLDSTLCARIGSRLEESAWVARVASVAKRSGGVVEIRCDYREPLAVIQVGDSFHLVAGDGVLLPGRYGAHGGLPVILGVTSALPEAGDPVIGADALAGVAMVQLLRNEAFLDQIVAIQVEGTGSTGDDGFRRIELVTDRSGGRIIWGSAPDYEVEENSVEQKLAILRHNFEQSGRLDLDYRVIDISVFPDRFIVPQGV